jgi:hypothetical protein
VTVARRIVPLVAWQIEQSLPDLGELLRQLPPARPGPLPKRADIWERATYHCELESLRRVHADELARVWLHMLVWHAAYTYCRLAVGHGGLRAVGLKYRSEDVQTEIRKAALHAALDALSC